MEKDSSNYTRPSLPPSVKGKYCGTLMLTIDEITWKRRSPGSLLAQITWWGQNPDEFQVLRPSDKDKSHNSQTSRQVSIVYDISTSPNLFKSYLIRCDPIVIKVICTETNQNIGYVNVQPSATLITEKKQENRYPILNNHGYTIGDLKVTLKLNFIKNNTVQPLYILPDRSDELSKDIITQAANEVSSKTGLGCGQSFKKSIHPDYYIDELKYVENEPRNEQYGERIYLEKIDWSSKSKNNSYRSSLKNKDRGKATVENNLSVGSDSSVDSTDIAVRSRQNILDFLQGADMSPEDERRALKDLRLLSPASSLMALAGADEMHVNTTNLERKHSKTNNKNPPKHNPKMQEYVWNSVRSSANTDSDASETINILRQVDSMKVNILNLNLTQAGVRIVIGSDTVYGTNVALHATFFVDYKIPEILKKTTSKTLKDEVKLCSKSSDGQNIPFNRQSTHIISLENCLQTTHNPSITFNIYWRKLNQKTPLKLGEAKLTLNEILNSKNLSCNRKCTVVGQNDQTSRNSQGDSKRGRNDTTRNNYYKKDCEVTNYGVVTGHLTVKVELGCGKLHFGKDFIDSFAVNKENTSASTESERINKKSPRVRESIPPMVLHKGNNKPCPSKKEAIKNAHLHHCLICQQYYSIQRDMDTQCRCLRHGNENNYGLPRTQTYYSDTKITTASGYQTLNNNQKQTEDRENVTARSESRSKKTEEENSSKLAQNTSENKLSDNNDVMEIDINEKSTDNSLLLHGLLFVGRARGLSVRRIPEGYQLISAGLNTDTSNAMTSEVSSGENFKYFETFPVLCDTTLLERCRNGHLLIEVWRKGAGPMREMIGVVSLPLHQFYIAYRDPHVVKHLLRSKLPVISVDGWIPLLSPISGTVVGEVQALLALGTEKQLEVLQINRDLKPDYVQGGIRTPPEIIPGQGASMERNDTEYHTIPSNRHVMFNDYPVEQPTNDRQGGLQETKGNTSEKGQNVKTSQYTETVVNNASSEDIKLVPERKDAAHNVPEHEDESYRTMRSKLGSNTYHTVETQTNFVDLNNKNQQAPEKRTSDVPQSYATLGAFIDQLVQQIPTNELSNRSNDTNPRSPQIRQTSELLDVLQKALSQNPKSAINENVAGVDSSATSLQVNADQQSGVNEVVLDHRIQNVNCFKALIEIEQALHLSKVLIHSRKCSKRSKCKTRAKNEVAPSTYVTFQALADGNKAIMAPEGPLLCTRVVQNTCNPQWEERFEVMLPSELLVNDQKRLIFKLWRKVRCEGATPPAPAPTEDVVIGFSAVDLCALAAGLPTIRGWFNIIDFAGSCKGQIKINVVPLENLSPLLRQTSACCTPSESSVSTDSTMYDIPINTIPFAPIGASVAAPKETKSYSRRTLNTQTSSVELNQSTVFPHLQNYGPQTQTENTNQKALHGAGSIKQNMPQQVFEMVDLSTSSLSRALKRKFTELDEITQRLKSRLFDVTADTDDFEDEFERDLNTECNELDFNVQPIDFMNVKPINEPLSLEIGDVEPELFKTHANNYQNTLSKLRSCYNPRDTTQMENSTGNFESHLSNAELLQKKTNINNLLEKLSLLTQNEQKNDDAEPDGRYVSGCSRTESAPASVHENVRRESFRVFDDINLDLLINPVSVPQATTSGTSSDTTPQISDDSGSNSHRDFTNDINKYLKSTEIPSGPREQSKLTYEKIPTLNLTEIMEESDSSISISESASEIARDILRIAEQNKATSKDTGLGTTLDEEWSSNNSGSVNNLVRQAPDGTGMDTLSDKQN